VNPSWAKGYARKGAALHGARRYDDAILAYEAGINLEDSPALRKGLQEVQDAKGMNLKYCCWPGSKKIIQASAASDDGLGLGKMFSDPNLFGKLAANPRTAKHLADPSFVQKVTYSPLL
jgi:stress-induced-phosphoprotein 1